MRSPAEELTGKALIRNAALRLFAEHGPDAVSVRAIAAEAGVSPALVLHHFGSKAGLRGAVDAYVVGRMQALVADDGGAAVAEMTASGSARSIAELFAEVFPPGEPIPAYLRRMLLSGDPAGQELFGAWFAVSRQMLDRMVSDGVARQSADPDVRAAYLLVADLGLLLLRDELATVLGTDPLSAEGMTRWAAEAAVIIRDGIVAAPEGDPLR
jgi:AcrR family transcriptional regulator